MPFINCTWTIDAEDYYKRTGRKSAGGRYRGGKSGVIKNDTLVVLKRIQSTYNCE